MGSTSSSYIVDGRNQPPYEQSTDEPHEHHGWYQQHRHGQPFLLHVVPMCTVQMSAITGYSQGDVLTLAIQFQQPSPTGWTKMSFAV